MVQELLNNQGERLARNEIEAGKVSATAREALERARQAGKLAEGKLVFETTLTNEVANFDFQEAQLNEAARNQLNEFAKRLKAENRGAFIEIQGYTDSSGPAEINLRLSRERAMAVRDYLHQEAGIPLHLLAVAAYGETRPIADNSSREGRGKNRRVVLVVLR
jgi:outer membrane protein OmpA-like peptidoglycan-associated protein